MLKFSAKAHGRSSLNLAAMIEAFANQQWVPAHMTPEQASAFVLDQFRRTVNSELQTVGIHCESDFAQRRG